MNESDDDIDVTVTITGKIGSGKTTVALALTQLLRDKGFTNVKLSDEFRDDVNEPYYTELQEGRLNAIRDRSIRIRTHQLSRTNLVAILGETVGRDPKSPLGDDDCG